MGLLSDFLDEDICLLAVQKWRDDRRQRGPRQRIPPDFLIGAHAERREDLLLIRDRSLYRAYSQGLAEVDPKRDR